MARICIINAHPDPTPGRFCHALADAYEEGAHEGWHTIERINIAELDVAPLSSVADFATPPPEPVFSEREKLAGADHVCLIFPLWLGAMPAKARAFFEQMARAEFLLAAADSSKSWPKKMMKGKSARIIVTMGMPGFAYKLVFDSGSLKALERGMLGISGFKPVRHTILGGVEAAGADKRKAWLQKINQLGQKAE
ncbi:NAD(P)H-dependent oxidoreductase [Henriciella aquimarina]|uniref:NAD(P)H-dependent oxidoreductase n=1 Tax=Henriciella aquimarina TaxID=545261 RepID=UPI000A02D447|nr:NAD(P)H-dependent oxidoreductase [Henriciella aquimarina]